MKKDTINNLTWKLLERFGSVGFKLLVTLILARLLNPGIYGQVAIVTTFTSILQILANSGFGTALIQKKDADEVDFFTVFWFNLLFCAIAYGFLYFLAPSISSFFNLGAFEKVIRAMGTVIIISGVRNILFSYISRKAMFKVNILVR